MTLDDRQIAELLASARTIALVGASSRPERESFGQMRYFQEQGYRVIPVNPWEREVLSEPAYASLEEVPEPVDVVMAFRRAEATPPIADAAAATGARVLWLPLGVSSERSRAIAERAGLGYIEDRCPMSTHRLMRRQGMLDREGEL